MCYPMTMIQNNWFIDPCKPWRGVHRRISIECTLPMGEWSNVLAIIKSTPPEDMSRRAFFPKVTLACDCCGATVIRAVADMRKHAKHGRKYVSCSNRCTQTLTNIDAGKFGQFCTVCGVKIHKNKRQCSEACKLVARKASGLKRRKQMGMFTCLVCNAENPITSLSRVHKFCSMTCKDKHHSLSMTGQANPQWRGGIDALRYDKDVQRAYKIARVKVIAIDGSKCVVCSSTKSLHCHHIDHDSTNNAHQNLVTLCKQCHLRHHAIDRSSHKVLPFPWLNEYAKRRTFTTSKSPELTAFLRTESLSTTA